MVHPFAYLLAGKSILYILKGFDMSNYNNATIEGRLTHDPVFKQTKTGKNVCSFSVAINHSPANSEVPQVSFIDVETWDKVADFCADTLAKGKKVLVMGSLKQERWEGKDGNLKSKWKMIGHQVRVITPLEKKPEAALEPSANVNFEEASPF